MLESPLEFNGLTINDQSQRALDFGKYYKLISATGLDDADVRDVRTERPGFDGELSSDSFYGGRSVVLSGQLRARTLQDLREMQSAMKKAFGDLKYHNLYFKPWGEPSRFIRVRKSQKLDMPEQQDSSNFYRPFTVGLRAEDPFAYSTIENINQFETVGITPNLRRYDIPSTQTITTNRRVEILIDTPLGFWELEEFSSAEPMRDSSGYNRDGVFTNPVLFRSQGAFYDENTHSIGHSASATLGTIPFISQLHPSTFTGEIWFKPQYGNTGVDSPLVSCKPFGVHSGWTVGRDSTNKWYIEYGNGSTLRITTAQNVLYDVWQHIRFWYDGTAMNIQINNGTISSNTSAFTPNPSYITYLGGDAGINGMLGQMDSFALFSGVSSSGRRNARYSGVSSSVNVQTRDYLKTYISEGDEVIPAVDNAGNHEAYPVTRIYGYIENPTLTNLTTGQRLVFTDLVIQEGSYIEINHKTGVIKWNGFDDNYSGFDLLQSEFWTLQPGENQLQLNGSNWTEAAYWQVIWRDTYL